MGNVSTIAYTIISSPVLSVLLSLFGIVLTMFFGAYGEYRYNIVSKINKLMSHIFNKKAEIKMNITYRPKKDFDIIKKELKGYFINKYDNYNLLNEKSSYITINFDIFTTKIIHTESNEVFFDIFKTGCGINDLYSKVGNLISTLNEINKTKGLFDKLISCEINIYLPYNWDYVKIYPPKGFELENYKIEIQDKEDYKTKVAVRFHSISAAGDTFEEITSLLRKLL